METNQNNVQNVKDVTTQNNPERLNAIAEFKAKEELKKEETVESTAKKQKVSATYTLRACGENARKLLELKLITEEECNAIQAIQKKALEAYIKAEMGL